MKMTALKPGQLRAALATLWELNFKVVLTSLVWSVSCIALLETSSLLARFIWLMIANGAVIASAFLIVKSYDTGMVESWRRVFTDKFNWSALTFSSLCLLLSLENVDQYQKAQSMMRIYVVAIFVAMLIGWLLVSILLIPLRIWASSQVETGSTLAMAYDYARKNRIPMVVALGVLLFAWPIFFLYLFLSLAFAQSLLVANFSMQESGRAGMEMESHSDVG
jgi:hypothetical protein